MAALVTGLIPILRTAVDSTTTYQCRSLWFGFLCIRVVILFLAQLPFTKLDQDFSCNATDAVCVRACYNRHFHKPMMAAWNFLFVLVILSVMLMELFTSHLRSLAQKRSRSGGGVGGNQAKEEVELDERRGQAEAQVEDGRGRMVIDLRRDRGTVLFYLFSIVLRVLVESWFVYVLLFWNLPALSHDPFQCSADACSGVRVCVVRAAPEKRMSIFALASISGVIIVCSVVFCVYAIFHYLCRR